MQRSHRHPPRPNRLLCAALALAALATPATALSAQAPTPAPSRQPVTTPGTLVQLQGAGGCLRDRARPSSCTAVRALAGPGPFLGSRAIAIDPRGKNVYVAASASNAIAILQRSAKTGKLTQAPGKGGCVAAKGAAGCTPALGLAGPNSVAVSADGRNVYATSVQSNSIAIFARNPKTGALKQAKDGHGCLSELPLPGCTAVRALSGPDVVIVSPDGDNVYVGAFAGGSIAVFTREGSTGALTQPAGAAGCIGGSAADGCASALALSAPEGLAISTDGNNVYAAAAASNAVAVLDRDPANGALTQPTDGTGCIVETPLAGCTTGSQLAGANAVVVSPDDTSVYVTTLMSNTVTSFTRSVPSGALAQPSGTSACVVYLLANGCSLGRAMNAPEGLTVSPDGGEVYVAAFGSGAVDTLARNAQTGSLIQKPRAVGCFASHATSDCAVGRALVGASSVVVSPDGRNLYAAAFQSDAVAVFKRVTRGS